MGSISYPKIYGEKPLNTTLAFLSKWSSAIARILPAIRNIRVMRVWSGYYVVSPDKSHILGRDDEWPEGLYVNTGYSGHGFMMAPFSGYLLARNILYGEVPKDMKPFLPDRFRKGKTINEPMVVG